MALLTHLQLVPEGVSKTFALDIFAKAKAKGAGKDKSELGQPTPTDDVCAICPIIFAAACVSTSVLPVPVLLSSQTCKDSSGRCDAFAVKSEQTSPSSTFRCSLARA